MKTEKLALDESLARSSRDAHQDHIRFAAELGAMRASYLAQERAVSRKVESSGELFSGMVKRAASKMGLEGKPYRFDVENGEFIVEVGE